MKPVDVLGKQFEYYLNHQAELLRSYRGRHVLIKDEEVIGDFSTPLEAYEFAAQEGLEPGTFLIQHVTPGTQDTQQTFNTRVG